jgi:hypothetical protein
MKFSPSTLFRIFHSAGQLKQVAGAASRAGSGIGQMGNAAGAAVMLLLMTAVMPITTANASSHTDKLLKQLISLKQIEIQLNQDNVIATRLNTMNIQLNNILANLEILVYANTVSINGTLVK